MSREDNSLDEFGGEPNISCEDSRIWLVVELLCTWEWPGGDALSQVLPYLWSLARSPAGDSEYNLLWGTLKGLFIGSSSSSGSKVNSSVPIFAAVEDFCTGIEEPFLRALLVLLQGLTGKEDRWTVSDARLMFRAYATRQEAAEFVSPICDIKILPHVLTVLMPILRKRGIGSADTSVEEEWQSFLQTAVSLWVQKAMTGPPLVAFESDSQFSGMPMFSAIDFALFGLLTSFFHCF